MIKRTSNISDTKLLCEIRNGNQDAFRQLFEKYWDDLYRAAHKRLRSREDIQDILQDIFLSLWNNIQHIEIDDSIAPYLFTSLKNKLFNLYEKKQHHLKLLMSQQFNLVESENSVWDQYLTKEMQNLLAQKAALLPKKMKQIFNLSKIQHLTNAEIAELLHLSPQTIKNQLHRAVGKIRKSLDANDLSSF